MPSLRLSPLVGACALMLASCASVSGATEVRSDGDRASFSEVLAQSVYVQKSAGLSFAIYKQDRLVESGAFGLADLETGRSIEAKTPTRLASVTKPIAAALTLQAVADGKLALNDPIWRHAPRFQKQCPAAKAYFREAGLPFLKAVICDDPAVRVGSVLSHTSNKPVGSTFAYDGFLYGRLREVIEGAYDQASMEAVIRAEFIEPLALENSIAGIEDEEAGELLPSLARPHALDEAEILIAKPFLDDEINAGAGMIASAPDAAKIFMSITQNEEIVRLFQRPVTLLDGTPSPYGYGVFAEQLDGRDLLWHTGWQPGAYNGLWIHDLTNQSGVVVLINTDLQELTGDFSGDTLSENAMAGLFLNWLDKQ